MHSVIELISRLNKLLYTPSKTVECIQSSNILTQFVNGVNNFMLFGSFRIFMTGKERRHKNKIFSELKLGDHHQELQTCSHRFG